MGRRVLQRLGLEGLLEDVYLELIRSQHWDADGLATRLQVPEEDVRAALSRLESLELVKSLDDGVRVLVEPRIGLNSLLMRRVSTLESLVREFEEDRQAVSTLLEVHAPVRSLGDEYVVGTKAVGKRLRYLLDHAEKAVVCFVPDGEHSAECLEGFLTSARKLDDRGVSVRMVCTDSISPAGSMLHGSGADLLRTAPSLPLGMCVVDQSAALLPVHPAVPSQSAVEISEEAALMALGELFELIWREAVPVGDEAGPNEHGLTAQEQEVLVLLSRGLTDDMVRRRMGVSLRTVRRVVADLSSRLKAQGRFEMAYRAAKEGWI